MSSFLSNTVWYVALAATSAFALAVIFINTHERRSKISAFWFAVLGFTYCIEISLLLLFSAYTYHPMIKPDDPFFDAVLGNIFSQVSVSSSAVLICVLGLNNWWLAGFSVGYYLIDVLFVQLGIYEHYWYQSLFTLGGFFIYGLVVRFWYKRVFSGMSKLIYYPTLYLSIFAVSSNLIGTLPKALDLRVFHAAFCSDPSRNHTAAALIYSFVMIVIMIALFKWRSPWRLKSVVSLLLLLCQWGLLQSGVIRVRPGWDIAIILFDLVVIFFGTAFMDRCLCSENPQRRPD